jgi:transcriptional regulator with XRE-family HTH domain
LLLKVRAGGWHMASLATLIGNRLKELRKQKGLKQEDLEDLGINYRYYQKVETGKANVTLKTFEKIADALGVDPADLFFLPLSKSKEKDELIVMIMEIINRKDKASLNKLKIFIKEIL